MSSTKKPILINATCSKILTHLSSSTNEFTERELQEICFNNAKILPISEIEPIYDGLIPVCMELAVPSGAIDIVYINSEGMITIAETKLWRNPQARREVVSQILDYAKDLVKLSYEDFEKRCIKARKGNDRSLFEIVSTENDDCDESQFVDNVCRNLKRGRFLLLIVGDGIRENATELTGFINRNSNMSFTLALVEVPIYEIDKETRLVVPNVSMQTTMIEREVYITADNRIEFTKSYVAEKRAQTATESEFYNQLGSNISREELEGVRNMVDEFVEELDLRVSLGRGKNITLSFKDSGETYNLGTIWPDGRVIFYGIVDKTDELGRSDIGENYLEKLASIMRATVERKFSRWHWTIMRDGRYLHVREYLENKDKWKQLITETLVEIAEVDN